MAADDPTAAVLPQSLIDELPNVVAAIHPAVHSAVPADAQTTRVARSAMIACYEFAPCAPLELLVEAAIRMGGWQIGAAPHARARDIAYPDGTARKVEINVATTASPLRHSGASALLAPYRQVRAWEGV